MRLIPPAISDVRDLANALELGIEEAELEDYRVLLDDIMKTYERVDELSLGDQLSPKSSERSSTEIRSRGECSLGWTVRTSIKERHSGRLEGKCIAVKDNISLAGVPLLNGSRIMEGFVPTVDATVVTRILAEGGEIVGKTAVPGFCVDGGGCTGYPEPQPSNPHDPDRMPGASSSGSAVVLVDGEADIALGGDQGGSIRLPAAWSGCTGIKPTFGLVPYTGIFPIEQTLDHVGPMAMTAMDCALALEVIAGEDNLDPRQSRVPPLPYIAELEKGVEGLRIGILSEGFGIPGQSEEEVDRSVDHAIEELSRLGASAATVSVPEHFDGLALWQAVAIEGATRLMLHDNACPIGSVGHYNTELADFYGESLKTKASEFSKTVKVLLLCGEYMAEKYNHKYYAKAQNLRQWLTSRYDEVFADYDVLAMPTVPFRALEFPKTDKLADIYAAAQKNLINTAPFDLTGHPAISFPVETRGSLPVGMQVIGPLGRDDLVLRVAHAYQTRLGG